MRVRATSLCLLMMARSRVMCAGAYGVVCSAKNKITGDSIAIKKVRCNHHSLSTSTKRKAS